MVDTGRKTTTNEVPDSGQVAIVMGGFSIALFFIVCIILSLVHNMFV